MPGSCTAIQPLFDTGTAWDGLNSLEPNRNFSKPSPGCLQDLYLAYIFGGRFFPPGLAAGPTQCIGSLIRYTLRDTVNFL